MWDLSSSTRDWTCAPCSRSAESWLLDWQKKSQNVSKEVPKYVVFCVLAFFTWHNIFEVHPYCSMYQHFIPFIVNSISLYGYTTFCSSIYPLMDIWVDSSLGLLWKMLLWTFATKLCINTCFNLSWIHTLEFNLIDFCYWI